MEAHTRKSSGRSEVGALLDTTLEIPIFDDGVDVRVRDGGDAL